MINELIEKEIEKVKEALCDYSWQLETLEKFAKTIAKEVAMRFKYKNILEDTNDSEKSNEWKRGYNWSNYMINQQVDQIINEVSE